MPTITELQNSELYRKAKNSYEMVNDTAAEIEPVWDKYSRDSGFVGLVFL